ncbi:MAG: AI-2E family transporter [Patescibacteria group bacterium]|jgi:predicted PurR-regulated permease PerM
MALVASENGKFELTISLRTIAKIVVVLFLIWLIIQLVQVVGIVFIALVLASAIDPMVDSLQKRKIPRVFAILIIYAALISVVSLVVALLVPLLTDQIQQFSSSLPNLYDRIVAGIDTNDTGLTQSIQEFLNTVNSSLGKITNGVFSGLAAAFGGLFSFVGILVLTFYFALEERGLRRFIRAVSPAQYHDMLGQLLSRIQSRLGNWLRGQLLLGVIIGALSFIGLSILGVKYALLLALIAGLTEFIPYAGPIIGAVPAVLLAFADSPLKALFVIILYIVIQQLENTIIQPKIMARVTGLNAVIIIIVMLAGAKLGGLAGIILAIPMVIIADTIFKVYANGGVVEPNVD